MNKCTYTKYELNRRIKRGKLSVVEKHTEPTKCKKCKLWITSYKQQRIIMVGLAPPDYDFPNERDQDRGFGGDYCETVCVDCWKEIKKYIAHKPAAEGKGRDEGVEKR